MAKLRKARPTAPGTPVGPSTASSSSSSPQDSLRRRTPSVASTSSHGSAPIALKSAAHLETIAVSPAVVSAAPIEPGVMSSTASGVAVPVGSSSTASSPRFYRTRFPSTSTIASSVDSHSEPFTPSPALAKLRSRLEMDRGQVGVRVQGEASLDSSGDADGRVDGREEGLHEPTVREVDMADLEVSAHAREAKVVDSRTTIRARTLSPDPSTRPLVRSTAQKRIATTASSRRSVSRPLTKPVELVMSAIQLWLGITLAALLVAKALVEIGLERVSKRRKG